MNLQTQSTHYRLLLLEELAERKRRNPAYSLTAFSKALGVSTPSLSQIISGKRPISRKCAKQIIERCSFADEKRRQFLESAIGVTGLANNAPVDVPNYGELQIDIFNLISDWHHYAILSLGDIKPNRANPKWISIQLGITLRDASNAFDRLLRLGLIKKKNGSYFQCAAPITMPGLSTNSALRRHLHQNLRKAEDALNDESVPIEYFSNITMAADESKLPAARELIREFRRKLCTLLESGKRERVYTLAVQLFPVSRRKENLHETDV